MFSTEAGDTSAMDVGLRLCHISTLSKRPGFGNNIGALTMRTGLGGIKKVE